MKTILVPVKLALDANVRPRVRADGGGIDLGGLKMSINPFCEIAVEEAVRLKEAGHAEEILVVSIGPAKAQDALRQALAIGADRAILIQTDARIEPLAIAKLLREVAREEQPDLILLGKQAIDDDSNQTGQMLAALLGWPQATFASAVAAVGEGQLEVTREVDAGLQTLRLPLPAIVTTDLRLNDPRFVSLPNIMKARKKPLDTRQAASLGVDIAPRLTVVAVNPPAPRKPGRRVDNAVELVAALRATGVL